MAPQQTAACTSAMSALSSLSTGMPTPPSPMVQWYVSLFTATDFTTALSNFHVTPPASLTTIASAAASYQSQFSSWSNAHASQFSSIASQCPGLEPELARLDDSNVENAVYSILSLPNVTAILVWPSMSIPSASAPTEGGRESSSSGDFDPWTVVATVLATLFLIALITSFVIWGKRRAAATATGRLISSRARFPPADRLAVPSPGYGENEIRPGIERESRRRKGDIEMDERVGESSHEAGELRGYEADYPPPPPAYAENESAPFISKTR